MGSGGPRAWPCIRVPDQIRCRRRGMRAANSSVHRERREERMESMNAEDDASQFALRFVFNSAAGDEMRSLDLDNETPAQADEREQFAMNSHAFCVGSL